MKLSFSNSASQAGVLDAVFSSLATFLAGIFAARVLNTTDLGTYALVFSTIILSAMISSQLIFVPIERDSLALPEVERMGVLNQSLWRGLIIAIVSAILACLLPYLLGVLEWSASNRVLTLTGGFCSLVWPIQDHMRRLMHCAAMHYTAALLSGINALGVIIAIVMITLTDISVIWGPLGSLVVGNTISIIVGLWIYLQKYSCRQSSYSSSFSKLMSSGKWLLGGMTIPAVCGFAVVSIITKLGGSAVLGQAEAARIVASPILVLATGISYVIRPSSMKAGEVKDLKGARKISINFAWMLLISVSFYLLIAGFPWFGNPMYYIVPRAYNIPGLVFITIIVNGIFAVSFPYRFELIGSRLEKAIMRVEAFGNMGRILVAITVGITNAYALPLSYGVLGLSRYMGFSFVSREIYFKSRSYSKS